MRRPIFSTKNVFSDFCVTRRGCVNSAFSIPHYRELRVVAFCKKKKKNTTSLKWSQREGPIQRNRAKTVGGNLTIESLRRTDFGFYQCVASNEVATISSSTQLIVEGTQPHAPYNVSGTATQFSVTLTWLPGYSGGPDYKQDYTIW